MHKPKIPLQSTQELLSAVHHLHAPGMDSAMMRGCLKYAGGMGGYDFRLHSITELESTVSSLPAEMRDSNYYQMAEILPAVMQRLSGTEFAATLDRMFNSFVNGTNKSWPGKVATNFALQAAKPFLLPDARGEINKIKAAGGKFDYFNGLIAGVLMSHPISEQKDFRGIYYAGQTIGVTSVNTPRSVEELSEQLTAQGWCLEVNEPDKQLGKRIVREDGITLMLMELQTAEGPVKCPVQISDAVINANRLPPEWRKHYPEGLPANTPYIVEHAAQPASEGRGWGLGRLRQMADQILHRDEIICPVFIVENEAGMLVPRPRAFEHHLNSFGSMYQDPQGMPVMANAWVSVEDQAGVGGKLRSDMQSMPTAMPALFGMKKDGAPVVVRPYVMMGGKHDIAGNLHFCSQTGQKAARTREVEHFRQEHRSSIREELPGHFRMARDTNPDHDVYVPKQLHDASRYSNDARKLALEMLEAIKEDVRVFGRSRVGLIIRPDAPEQLRRFCGGHSEALNTYSQAYTLLLHNLKHFDNPSILPADHPDRLIPADIQYLVHFDQSTQQYRPVETPVKVRGSHMDVKDLINALMGRADYGTGQPYDEENYRGPVLFVAAGVGELPPPDGPMTILTYCWNDNIQGSTMNLKEMLAECAKRRPQNVIPIEVSPSLSDDYRHTLSGVMETLKEKMRALDARQENGEKLGAEDKKIVRAMHLVGGALGHMQQRAATPGLEEFNERCAAHPVFRERAMQLDAIAVCKAHASAAWTANQLCRTALHNSVESTHRLSTAMAHIQDDGAIFNLMADPAIQNILNRVNKTPDMYAQLRSRVISVLRDFYGDDAVQDKPAPRGMNLTADRIVRYQQGLLVEIYQSDLNNIVGLLSSPAPVYELINNLATMAILRHTARSTEEPFVLVGDDELMAELGKIMLDPQQVMQQAGIWTKQQLEAYRQPQTAEPEIQPPAEVSIVNVQVLGIDRSEVTRLANILAKEAGNADGINWEAVNQWVQAFIHYSMDAATPSDVRAEAANAVFSHIQANMEEAVANREQGQAPQDVIGAIKELVNDALNAGQQAISG